MKIFVCFCIVLLLVVVLIGGCADRLARVMLFYPTRYSQNIASETYWEVQFPNSRKQMLTGCYFPYQKINPAEPAVGTILYFHGNAENVLHRIDFAQQLRSDFRCNVLIMDYAGYGKSEGKPTAPGVLDDGLAAFNYLTQEQKIPPEQIIVYGFSLGGCAAVDLASKHNVKALIVESSFTSLGEIGENKLPFIPAKKLLWEQLASVDKIGNVRCPIFISHGKGDRVIPFEQGEILFAAAKEPKMFYVPPEGSDYHSAPPCAEHHDKLRQFFASLRQP